MNILEFIEAKDANSPKSIRDAVCLVVKQNPGVTIGVVFNKLKRRNKSDVAKAMQSLVDDKQIRAEARSGGRNGKPTIAFFPVGGGNG